MIEDDDSKPTTESALRTATQFVVGTSVKFIITTTIAAMVPADSKIQKIKLIVGSYAIAAMVAENAQARVDRQFDSLSEGLASAKQAIEKKPEEIVEPPTS